MVIRPAAPEDYQPIITVLDDWWGGRQMAAMLPRLFFVHFRETSFVAIDEGTIIGFLVGFFSQSRPHEAYVHFVGVHPRRRQAHVGQALYQQFFEAVRARGCRRVSCVTSPANGASLAFHQRLGFVIEPGSATYQGLAMTPDYDGPGEDRVRLCRELEAAWGEQK